ncbi:MAG: ABC transporter permease [Actinobacteria bacterium]|nr:ABC transporter permease [Actinomycetota bacterium]
MANNTIGIADQTSIFKRTIKRLRNVEILGIIITLIVECIILSFLSPYFLTAKNIINVLRAISINAIVTVGMTMVLISGGLDLSVGSVIGLGGMVTAFFLTNLGMSLPVALIAGIGTGAVIGYAISLFVTKLNINSFIVTLGFLSVARGIIYLFSTGANIKVTNPIIIYLGQGTAGVIPVSVILMAVIVIIGAVFLKYSVTGRYIYAIGGNERAARLSGIRIENVRMLVFILTSALAAFAGVVTIGRLGTAEVIAGTGAEIDIIAAVIIGGTLLSGGKGSIIGSLIGAAIIGVLRNGFVILGLPIAAQTIGIGIVVILSVTIDSLRSRRAT